eukprot:SAG11_NODE_8529_length_1005_cov_1.281457_1_plen_186_part_10
MSLGFDGNFGRRRANREGTLGSSSEDELDSDSDDDHPSSRSSQPMENSHMENLSSGDDDDESSEEEEDEQEEELSRQDIPMGDILKMKRNGYSTSEGESGGGRGTDGEVREKVMRPARSNKHRPLEMSSKRAVGRYREVVKPQRECAPNGAGVSCLRSAEPVAATRSYSTLRSWWAVYWKSNLIED